MSPVVAGCERAETPAPPGAARTGCGRRLHGASAARRRRFWSMRWLWRSRAWAQAKARDVRSARLVPSPFGVVRRRGRIVHHGYAAARIGGARVFWAPVAGDAAGVSGVSGGAVSPANGCRSVSRMSAERAASRCRWLSRTRPPRTRRQRGEAGVPSGAPPGGGLRRHAR